MDKLNYSEQTTRAAVKKVCGIPIRSRVVSLHNVPQSSLLLEGLMTYYQYGFEVYLRYSIMKLLQGIQDHNPGPYDNNQQQCQGTEDTDLRGGQLRWRAPQLLRCCEI